MINYWAVLSCAVLAMVLGSFWYGPLFGKAYMSLVGLSSATPEKQAQMKKNMWQLYLLQFALAFFQVWVLSTYSIDLGGPISLLNALWIWLGFVMPTIAGTCIWTSSPRKSAWQLFLIQMGYQLLCFVSFGLILGYWA